MTHAREVISGRSHGGSGESDETGPEDVDLAGFLGDIEAVVGTTAIAKEDILPLELDRLRYSVCFKFSLMAGGNRQLWYD